MFKLDVISWDFMFLVKYVIIFWIDVLKGVVSLFNCGRIVVVWLLLLVEMVLVYWSNSDMSCNFLLGVIVFLCCVFWVVVWGNFCGWDGGFLEFMVLRVENCEVLDGVGDFCRKLLVLFCMLCVWSLW